MRTCPFTGHSINVSSEKLISGPFAGDLGVYAGTFSMSEELEISAVSLMSAELVKSTVLSRLAMSVADELLIRLSKTHCLGFRYRKFRPDLLLPC